MQKDFASKSWLETQSSYNNLAKSSSRHLFAEQVFTEDVQSP